MFSTALCSVHKADGGGLWWMSLEHLSRAYIEISISSCHQIRLAAQELSAFQNPNEAPRVSADCQTSGFLHIAQVNANKHYMYLKSFMIKVLKV